jgi:hypothetical protein
MSRREFGGLSVVACAVFLLVGCGRSTVEVDRADGPTDSSSDGDAGLDPGRDGAVPGDNNGSTTDPDPDPGPGPDPAPDHCSPEDARCDGDIAVRCIDGALEEFFCQEEAAYCAESSGGDAVCVPWECEPGVSACLDGQTSGICSPRGDRYQVIEPCEHGCDPDSGDCREEPESRCDFLDEVPVLLVGVTRFNLCGGGDDQENVQAEGCQADGDDFSGEDMTFGLVIDRRSRVRLDLRDDDGESAIDTVLYVQGVCGVPDSQIACHDDLECEESNIDFDCSDGRQVRHSRIELILDPGVYYVVADEYSYSRRGRTFRCGQVSLTYELSALQD